MPKPIVPNVIFRPKSPWGVHCLGYDFDDPNTACNGGAIIYLTAKEYDEQMSHPNRTWRCPYCRCEANWSDRAYEEFYGHE
jgi:hypothetical protein